MSKRFNWTSVGALGAVVVALLAGASGCGGDRSVCAAAADHVRSCQGAAMQQTLGACAADEATAAESVLSLSCEEIARSATQAKADNPWCSRALRWLGQCYEPEYQPSPTAEYCYGLYMAPAYSFREQLHVTCGDDIELYTPPRAVAWFPESIKRHKAEMVHDLETLMTAKGYQLIAQLTVAEYHDLPFFLLRRADLARGSTAKHCVALDLLTRSRSVYDSHQSFALTCEEGELDAVFADHKSRLETYARSVGYEEVFSFPRLDGVPAAVAPLIFRSQPEPE